VDPFLADLQLPQRLGEFDGVAAGAKVGRRALQHGDVAAFIGDRWNKRRSGRTRTDHDDLLVR
jgi:hypothetical protein